MKPLRVFWLLAALMLTVALAEEIKSCEIYFPGYSVAQAAVTTARRGTVRTRARGSISRLPGLPRDGGRSRREFHHGFSGAGEILGRESRRQYESGR